MKAFTDVNSKLNRYATLLMDFFILNMIFLLTSFPIVTIGAGLTALSSVSIELIEGRMSSPLKSYLFHFKSNFSRGILNQLFLTSILLILFLSARLLFILPTISFILVGTGLILGMIIFTFVTLYIFSYTARYENGFFASFKVVFQLSMSNLRESFVMVLIILTILSLASLSVFWASLMTFSFFFIGFSVFSFLNTFLTLKVFNQYNES